MECYTVVQNIFKSDIYLMFRSIMLNRVVQTSTSLDFSKFLLLNKKTTRRNVELSCLIIIYPKGIPRKPAIPSVILLKTKGKIIH